VTEKGFENGKMKDKWTEED